MFDDWMLAVGFPTTAAFAPRKAALLRASLGAEGSRIYYSLAVAPDEPYARVVERMEGHFGRPAGVIFNRAQFSRNLQRSSDSIVQYISTLKELAHKCDFADAQLDERVRDQFAAGCSNDRIRERLLQEPATRTLDDLVTLAVTMERALAEAPALATHNAASVSAIDGRDRKSSVRRYNGPPPAQQTSDRSCKNCGRRGHSAREGTCPALHKTCDGCGKIGHFRSVCRSGSSKSSTQSEARSYRRRSKSRGRRSGTTNVVEVETAVQQQAVNSVVINTIQIASATVQSATSGTLKTVTCRLNNRPTELLVDLGAKVSIINHRTFIDLQLSKLDKPDAVLHAYSGQVIKCMGVVRIKVELNSYVIPSFKFFVTSEGRSIMGVDLFDALGGVARVAGVVLPSMTSLRPTQQLAIAAVAIEPSSVTLEQYPSLLKQTGVLKGFVHSPLVDKSVKPVRQAFWHPPLAKRQPIADELQRLERDGVIERIDASPWTSNVVTAVKKDGGLRLCVNLSDVNRAIIPDRYPLPTMDELTEKLAGSTVFTKIDLLWGYLQLELAEDKRYLTSFVTHVGVFRFKRLPFGLASGPSAFHQVIRTILKGLDGCESILDDILVHGRGTAQHDQRLRLVLERLTQHNATVRKDKCIIGASAVEFNGHRISAVGLQPLSSNVDAILRIPVPVEPKQLARFVSTAVYYLKFVQGFADICDPLRQLLKADAVWNWTPTCQHSFDQLKRCLSSPPVLAHFDVTKPTLVTCDASAVAIAAALSQRHDGKEPPVAFPSRTLSETERRYSASEREALACMWACEHWNFFLYGRRFTLITDHQALKTLLTTGGSGHRPLRLHRWSDRLNQYNFALEFRPGKLNVVADCLSRSFETPRPTAQDPPQPPVASDVDDEDCAVVNTIFGNLASPVVTIEAVASATSADSELQSVSAFVLHGWPTSKAAVTSSCRSYYELREELSIVSNCLLRGCRVVVPSSLRKQMLELAHEGHPGVARMKGKCRETIWWPGIDADIERYVRDCSACVISGKSVRPSPGPLQPVNLPSGPWRKISLDIAGEFVAAPRGHRFMLVAVDYFSKWPEAVTCESVTSSVVIDFLNSLWDRFGLVEEVATDNGSQFTSSEFTSYLKSHGIRHCLSAFYSPQANAEVERFNRVMKEGLRAGLADGRSFSTAMRQTLAAYRTTPHTTTGVTPASLVLAFPVRTPLSMLPMAVTSAPQLASSRSSSPPLPVAAPSLQSVRSKVSFAQNRMSADHDRRHRAKASIIKPGDFVRIRLPVVPHKLAPRYSEPRAVVKAAGNTVWLQNGQRWNLRRCLLHRSVLKQSTPATTSSVEPPDHASSSSDEDSPMPVCLRVPQQQQQPQQARRSQRMRRPRDFGPVIAH